MSAAKQDPKAPSESAWSQKSFVAAAAVLAVIAAFALILVVAGPSEPAGRANQAQRSLPAAAEKTAAQSRCGLDDGSQRVPTAAPPKGRWELVGTMLAPTAPATLGPGMVEDGVRSCFAHSPTGALYAAVNFWALGTAKPSEMVIRQLAADTPERTNALAQLDPQTDVPSIRSSMQLTGFRFVSYRPATATVELAMTVSNGRVMSFPATLRWEDGDWKYVIGPRGNPGIAELTSLTNYVLWGGA